MTKDDYAKMKVRQEIVAAFMSKLKKVDIEDRYLIPAFYDYVVTGNCAMFDKYNKFREVRESVSEVSDDNPF